jgi:serine/threonine protein kinase
MAPEVMWPDYAAQIGGACDLWAAGCVMAELLSGSILFQRVRTTDEHMAEAIHLVGAPEDMSYVIRDSVRDRICDIEEASDLQPALNLMLPSDTPDHARDLVFSLLHLNPAKRPSAAAAMCHPYFDGLKMPFTAPGFQPRPIVIPPQRPHTCGMHGSIMG